MRCDGLENYRVDENGCWLWQGALNMEGGYPRIGDKGYAHRLMYEREKGPIPSGLTLDHFRMNPGPRQAPCSRACLNPDHVEPVTVQENVMRGNSPPAQCARKTHCLHGHPFDEANTYIYPNLERRCRACARRQTREHRRREHLSGRKRRRTS